MSIFKYQVVRGLDCPKKYLISNEEGPLFFCNTARIASKCISYLDNPESSQLPENTERFLNKILARRS